jgi:Sigma-70 region 2
MGRRKYWFCQDCYAWHSESECPNAAKHYVPGPITNYNSAVDFIEWRLAQSVGGGEALWGWVGGHTARDLVIAALAARIVEFAHTTMWGDKLKERYLQHPEIAPYILYLEHPDEIPPGVHVLNLSAIDKRDDPFLRSLKFSPYTIPDPDLVLAKHGIGHNQPDGRLTLEQKELVWRHYPKIKKEADKRSGSDPTLLDDLLTVGIERAYQLVREFDPNQGVTFGKYIEKHLWGAMRDHAKGARRIVSGIGEDKIDGLHFGRISPRAKRAASPDDVNSKKKWTRADRRTGGFFKGEIHSAKTREGQRKLLSEAASRYRAAGGTIRRREGPTPLTPELLAAARLNKRQEMVYREWFENGSPIAAIARRIGNLEGKTVDDRQVYRIKRQAIRRIEAAKALLAKSVR